MKHNIVCNPVGMVDFELDRGDVVTAESGAMVYMRGDIRTDTGTRRGGLLRTLKSTVLAGESFFVNRFIAESDGCRLGVTGNMLGDVAHLNVTSEYIVQGGSYIASTGDLTLDTEWQGFARGIFGSSLFMLKTVGSGDLFVEGWGGIRRVDLDAGETMILDNFQLVAMEASMQYDVGKHGSIKTALFGGEALVLKVRGPGTLYYQTKNLVEFARALAPLLPKRNR